MEKKYEICLRLSKEKKDLLESSARADGAKRGLYLLDQIYELMHQIAKK